MATKISYDEMTIQYDGEELLLKGKYYPYSYNGYLDPPDPEQFEIEEVWYKGVDITWLIGSGVDMSDLEEKALEKADGGSGLSF